MEYGVLHGAWAFWSERRRDEIPMHTSYIGA